MRLNDEDDQQMMISICPVCSFLGLFWRTHPFFLSNFSLSFFLSFSTFWDEDEWFCFVHVKKWWVCFVCPAVKEEEGTTLLLALSLRRGQSHESSKVPEEENQEEKDSCRSYSCSLRSQGLFDMHNITITSRNKTWERVKKEAEEGGCLFLSIYIYILSM